MPPITRRPTTRPPVKAPPTAPPAVKRPPPPRIRPTTTTTTQRPTQPQSPQQTEEPEYYDEPQTLPPTTRRPTTPRPFTEAVKGGKTTARNSFGLRLRAPSALRTSNGASSEREDNSPVVEIVSPRGRVNSDTSGRLRVDDNDDFGRETAASYNPPLASAVAVSRPDKPLADGSTPPCTLTGKNFCVFTSDYPV